MVADILNDIRSHTKDCYSYEKTNKNIEPLEPNPILYQAADNHAKDMAANNYFEHQNKLGQTAGTRLEKLNYHWKTVGELLAAGQRDIDKAFMEWIIDPEYCQILLDTRFKEFGMAHVYNTNPEHNYKEYWVLLLAR